MEKTSEKKTGSFAVKIIVGVIVIFTLATIYLTIKLIYYGFTFR